MFKVKNRNTRTMCEISSELIIKTPERHQWLTSCSNVYTVNFEQVNDGWESLRNNWKGKITA